VDSLSAVLPEHQSDSNNEQNTVGVAGITLYN